MSNHATGPAGPIRFVEPRREAKQKEEAAPEAVTEATIETREIVVVPEASQPAPPAEQRPIPTMGFPKGLYEFKRLFQGDNAKPPRLSKKEVAKLAQEDEVARLQKEAEDEATRRIQVRAESIAYLRKLSDERPHLVVAFVGVKGAAATTTTMVNCTSSTSDITRVLMYGADFNPASGSAGARLGKDFDESMSVREFSELVDTVHSRKDINAKLRPTEYGVRVLVADDYVLVTTEHFGTKVSKMLDVLDENCDYLFVDTPNDIQTAASRALLEKADVLVFTANTGVKDSLRMLYVSMEKVRQLGMQNKVANSVVVISNIPEGAEVDDYRKYLNRVNLEHKVTQEIRGEDFHGPFLGVPHDPIVALDTQVKLEQYNWETFQAYVDIDIAIIEQALKSSGQPYILGMDDALYY